MSTSALEIIGNCRFFGGLEGDTLSRILSMAIVRHYRPGEVIFRVGQPCPGIFVVGTGQVRVYKLAPSGKEHVLHFALPGMTFAVVMPPATP